MRNQIRKMIGLLIARASGHCGDDHWERAFINPFEEIPVAPANGLVLRHPHYEKYERKYGHKYGIIVCPITMEISSKFSNEHFMPDLYSLNGKSD